MAKSYIEPPPVESTAVFKDDLFKGKVLFCTGGGSGICKAMTQAVVSLIIEWTRDPQQITYCYIDEARRECCHRGTQVCCLLCHHLGILTTRFTRLDRLEASAKELSAATGSQCIAAQADVRNPKQLQDAVAKTIEKYGRIDFVICGVYKPCVLLKQTTRADCTCAIL